MSLLMSLPQEIRDLILEHTIRLDIIRNCWSRNSQYQTLTCPTGIRLTLGPGKLPCSDPWRIHIVESSSICRHLLRTSKAIRQETIEVLAARFSWVGLRIYGLYGPNPAVSFTSISGPDELFRKIRHVKLRLQNQASAETWRTWVVGLQETFPSLHTVSLDFEYRDWSDGEKVKEWAAGSAVVEKIRAFRGVQDAKLIGEVSDAAEWLLERYSCSSQSV